jgi:hypothetical protein
MKKLYLEIKAVKAEEMIRAQANIMLRRFENDDMFDGNEEGLYITPKLGEPYWQNKELFERQHIEFEGIDTSKKEMVITDKDAMRMIEGIETKIVDSTMHIEFILGNGYSVSRETNDVTEENKDSKRQQLINEMKRDIRFSMILMCCLGINGMKMKNE